jgi:hypothetical protein
MTDNLIDKIVEFRYPLHKGSFHGKRFDGKRQSIISSYGIGEIQDVVPGGYHIQVIIPIPERGTELTIRRSDIIRVLNKDSLKKIELYEENYMDHESGIGKPGTWNDGYNYKDYMRKKMVRKPKPKRKVCSCKRK